MLAKEVEHTVDVDGMLDRMDPKLFAEWCIMHKIWDEQANAAGEPQQSDDPLNMNAMRRLAGV